MPSWMLESRVDILVITRQETNRFCPLAEQRFLNFPLCEDSSVVFAKSANPLEDFDEFLAC